jgi:hypothetical protein
MKGLRYFENTVFIRSEPSIIEALQGRLLIIPNSLDKSFIIGSSNGNASVYQKVS